MIYLAPRQQLFAIIVLISFLLHTSLLVFSTEKQIIDNRTQKAQRMATQILNESTLSIANEDRVSLSVIANHYTNEYDVNRIIIRNDEGKVLVQVGDAPMEQGPSVVKLATNNNLTVGKVELTMQSTNKRDIINMLWIFILGSFVMHFLLWVLYRHIARPTNSQLKALSDEIHQHYLKKYYAKLKELDLDLQAEAKENIHKNSNNNKKDTMYDREGNSAKDYIDSMNEFNDIEEHYDRQDFREEDDIDDEGSVVDNANSEHVDDMYTNTKQETENSPPKTDKKRRIREELSAFLQKQSEKDKIEPFIIQPTDPIEFESGTDKKSADKEAGNSETNERNNERNNDGKNLNKDTSSTDTLQIQVNYIDTFKLLDKLSDEVATPYFQLCTQLFTQSSTELLKLDLLEGVVMIKRPHFGYDGCFVELYEEDNDQKKLALAGVMLGILYKMLNQVIYDKRRELGRFAFPTAIGISQAGREKAMEKLMEKNANKDDVMMLLTVNEIEFIKQFIGLDRIRRPTNVSERECAYVQGVDEETSSILTNIRDMVLKVEK